MFGYRKKAFHRVPDTFVRGLFKGFLDASRFDNNPDDSLGFACENKTISQQTVSNTMCTSTLTDKQLDRSNCTLYGQIATMFREMILEGRFKPGDTLPSEREIAAQLNVSRIPVREAMKSLEYLGVVRQVRGKGVVVQEADLAETFRTVAPLAVQSSPELLENLFDFRLQLEPYAAEQAAVKATDEEIRALGESLEVHRQSIEQHEKVEEISFEFHLQVMQASHNEIIRSVSEFLGVLQRQSRHMTLWNAQRRLEAYEDHVRIFQAIEEHDAPKARQYMLEHLLQAKRVLPTVPKTH